MMGAYYHKGVLYLAGTWLSGPGEVPEDFPEYFTTEDMEAEELQPDLDALEGNTLGQRSVGQVRRIMSIRDYLV